MTDPIADLLTRLRNAYAANKKTVSLPHSRQKEALSQVLHQAGFIEALSVQTEQSGHKTLNLTLKYQNRTPIMTHLKRLSKPGRRVYISAKDIKPPLSGYGISLISTNQGIMTHHNALAANLGGEIICEIY